MPSLYLQPSEYATFGQASATANQVTQASAIIDAFIQRPEGLIVSPDAAGNPAYMAALSPALTLTAQAGISPGSNVSVPMSGAYVSAYPGMALVLDRADATKVETVVVVAVSGNTLTLGSVANAHLSGCLLESGLCITERKNMPSSRPITMLAKTPVARILSGRGRYGYGRRGSMNDSTLGDFNLLASMQQFGGPPMWEMMSAANMEYDAANGTVWVPSGILLAYYTEVELNYVAGYLSANLPAVLKQACANIIGDLSAAPGAGFKSQAAGDTSYERFAQSFVNADTKALLAPFMAKSFA